MNSNEINLYSTGNPNLSLHTTLAYSNSEFCDISPTAKNIAIAVLLIAICVVTFCGNLAVCLTVYANRTLHTTTNILIVSLALADLLVSLFSMPFRIDFMLHNEYWCNNMKACSLWIWIDMVACSSSVGSLAAVSIERFVAVKCPLRYPVLMSQRTGLAMIIVVWSYSAIWASLGHYNWTLNRAETFAAFRGCGKNDRLYYTIVAAFAFFLPLGIVIAAYCYLTKVAFHQRRRTMANSVRPAESTDAPHKAIRRGSILQELKAAKMMACVVGVFCISWVPFFVLLFLSLWQGFESTPAVAEIFVTILPNLNSSLNPFLYMAFTRELRQQVAKMIKALPVFKLCRSDPRDSVETSTQTRAMTVGETNIRSTRTIELSATNQ